LLNLDIINMVRKEGGKKYYKLNKDSEVVKLLGQFHTQLIAHSDVINVGTEIHEVGYVGRVLASNARKRRSKSKSSSHERESEAPRELLKTLGYLEGEV